MAERLHHNLARLTTEYAVVKAILDNGKVTRAQLSEITRLSRPTLIDVLAEFRDRSIIVAETRRSGGNGRDPEVISINPLYKVGFGADVGGSKIAAALVDLRGDVLAEVVAATAVTEPHDLVRQLVDMRTRLISEARIDSESVSNSAIGIPGVLQSDGRILHAGNLSGLDTTNVLAELQSALGPELQLENDVNMAAIGELSLFTDQPTESFVLISIGTGLGMAIINDGKLMRGSSGRAGEIGYLPIDADLDTDDVRLHGAAETVAAGPSLERMYASAIGVPTSAEAILDLADAGDPAAAAVLADYCRILARVVFSAAVIVDPSFIVLNGGLGSNHRLLVPLQAELERIASFPVTVRSSTLGNRAGLVGALSVARRHNIDDLLQIPQIEYSVNAADDHNKREPRRGSSHVRSR